MTAPDTRMSPPEDVAISTLLPRASVRLTVPAAAIATSPIPALRIPPDRPPPAAVAVNEVAETLPRLIKPAAWASKSPFNALAPLMVIFDPLTALKICPLTLAMLMSPAASRSISPALAISAPMLRSPPCAFAVTLRAVRSLRAMLPAAVAVKSSRRTIADALVTSPESDVAMIVSALTPPSSIDCSVTISTTLENRLIVPVLVNPPSDERAVRSLALTLVTDTVSRAVSDTRPLLAVRSPAVIPPPCAVAVRTPVVASPIWISPNASAVKPLLTLIAPVLVMLPPVAWMSRMLTVASVMVTEPATAMSSRPSAITSSSLAVKSPPVDVMPAPAAPILSTTIEPAASSRTTPAIVRSPVMSEPVCAVAVNELAVTSLNAMAPAASTTRSPTTLSATLLNTSPVSERALMDCASTESKAAPRSRVSLVSKVIEPPCVETVPVEMLPLPESRMIDGAVRLPVVIPPGARRVISVPALRLASVATSPTVASSVISCAASIRPGIGAGALGSALGSGSGKTKPPATI